MSRSFNCLIGFDGFTDSIFRAVSKRLSVDAVSFFPTIASFVQRLSQAEKISCNIELILQEERLGGNAPLMAQALLENGATVDFIGTIALDEPLFTSFIQRCRHFYSLGKSAQSEAIEFSDGKIILGKHSSILHVDERVLQDNVGAKLKSLLEEADLVAMVNWTMLPGMNRIWHYLQTLSYESRAFFFFDLADPAKRTTADLEEAISLIAGFKNTILGLNEAESAQVQALFGSSFPHNLGIDEVVVHTKTRAVAYRDGKSYSYDNELIAHPTTTTGAGDNFNAGYCLARLNGLNPTKCLERACQVARTYITK